MFSTAKGIGTPKYAGVINFTQWEFVFGAVEFKRVNLEPNRMRFFRKPVFVGSFRRVS